MTNKISHEFESLSPEGLAVSPARDGQAGPSQLLKGVGVAPGIAIGPAYLYARTSFTIDERLVAEGDVNAEISRFERAVRRAERDLKKIISVTREKLGEDSAEIFEAQRLMLRDSAVYEAVVERIRDHRHNADYAVKCVMREHRQRMEASNSVYMQERAHDLADVQDRVIRHLRRRKLLSAVDPGTIIVAESLTAADLVLFSRRNIRGCVMDHGGATSHVSIMARALGLPTVVGTHNVTEGVDNGDLLVLDGQRGRVFVRPASERVEAYRCRQERLERRREEQRELVPLSSETKDGRRVTLRANVEFREEIDLLAKYGAEGVGLFRTEVMLLMRGDLSLSEEDAYRTYRSIVEDVAPALTTFRVLDLGGDKMLPLAHREHNPFLGWRGVRLLLDKPELLHAQLRALLRASAHGPTRILLPMVTLPGEVMLFKEEVRRVKDELTAEGRPFDPEVPVGIMVEVPAVALQAERFAQMVDFFSIGTNDLTQYVLAVDRGNDLVAGRYSEFHPSVLALIDRIARAARAAGIPVSLCGEMAADPRAAPLLVGLGLDELSASPIYLPEIKRVVRAIRRDEAERLAQTSLQATDASAVLDGVDEWMTARIPEVAAYLDGEEELEAVVPEEVERMV